MRWLPTRLEIAVVLLLLAVGLMVAVPRYGDSTAQQIHQALTGLQVRIDVFRQQNGRWPADWQELQTEPSIWVSGPVERLTLTSGGGLDVQVRLDRSLRLQLAGHTWVLHERIDNGVLYLRPAQGVDRDWSCRADPHLDLTILPPECRKL